VLHDSSFMESKQWVFLICHFVSDLLTIHSPLATVSFVSSLILHAC
jgi:hypothetical protein